MNTGFYNRVPGSQTSASLDISGFTQSEKVVVIVGHRAANGGDFSPPSLFKVIENFGDPVAAAAECVTAFGADSEIGEMVVAAINSLIFCDLPTKSFPKIYAAPMTHGDDDLESFLATMIQVKMPHVAVPYPMTDATNNSALKLHLEVISGVNKGSNGQFGSIGYMATDGEFATVGAEAEAKQSRHMAYPWLRDSDGAKANKVHEVAAAFAILMAANPVPYNPTNDIRLGKIKAPALTADYHTTGDTGTVALGLDSGLIPLYVDDAGEVRISRAIVSMKTDNSVPDKAYYDIQDWQCIYEYRFSCYLESKREPFTNKKLNVQKAKDFKSAIFSKALTFESLGMFQNVAKLADQFSVVIQPGNRNAAIVKAPVDVIPGFHQKGIDVVGTNQFDLVEIQ